MDREGKIEKENYTLGTERSENIGTLYINKNRLHMCTSICHQIYHLLAVTKCMINHFLLVDVSDILLRFKLINF